MKIWDIEPKSNIILKITVNGQYIDLPTVAYKQESDGIICDAIRINDRVVSISSPNISVELMYIRKQKSPVVWKGVICESVILESKTYYKIMSKDEGAEKNRREAYRLFLGCHGVAQIGTNRKAIDVMVKDVSDTGFAFITGQDIESVEGTPVRLVFFDSDNQFSLMGLVVRKVPIEDSGYIYGCRLSVDNIKLSRFIAAKQRNGLSKNKDDKEILGKVGSREVSASDDKPKYDSNIKYAKKVKNNELELDPDIYEEIKKQYRNKANYIKPGERALDTVEREERRVAFRKTNEGKRF